jgi:hypothetical protein
MAALAEEQSRPETIFTIRAWPGSDIRRQE